MPNEVVLHIDPSAPFLTDEEYTALRLFLKQWQDDPTKISQEISQRAGVTREALDTNSIKIEKSEHKRQKKEDFYNVGYRFIDIETSTSYFIKFAKPIKRKFSNRSTQQERGEATASSVSTQDTGFIVIDNYLGGGTFGWAKSSATDLDLTAEGQLARKKQELVVKTLRSKSAISLEEKKVMAQSETDIAFRYLEYASLREVTTIKGEIKYEIAMPRALADAPRSNTLLNLILDGTIGQLSYTSQLELIRNIVKEIGAFHESTKCVHLDIKLNNIIVDPDTLRVKLIDFGCSLPIGSDYYQAVEPYPYQDPKRLAFDYASKESSDYFSVVLMAAFILTAESKQCDKIKHENLKPFYEPILVKNTPLDQIDYNFDHLEEQLKPKGKTELIPTLKKLTQPTGKRITGEEFVKEIEVLISKKKLAEETKKESWKELSKFEFNFKSNESATNKIASKGENLSSTQNVDLPVKEMSTDKCKEIIVNLAKSAETFEESCNTIKTLLNQAREDKDEVRWEFIKSLLVKNVKNNDNFRLWSEHKGLLQECFDDPQRNSVTQNAGRLVKEMSADKCKEIIVNLAESAETFEESCNTIKTLLSQAREDRDKVRWQSIKSLLVENIKNNDKFKLRSEYREFLQEHFDGPQQSSAQHRGSFWCRFFGGETASWKQAEKILTARKLQCPVVEKVYSKAGYYCIR